MWSVRPNMNAVLTEPDLVGLPLWGMVWFGMGFQALVFPVFWIGNFCFNGSLDKGVIFFHNIEYYIDSTQKVVNRDVTVS